jgi:hypothetical protein
VRQIYKFFLTEGITCHHSICLDVKQEEEVGGEEEVGRKRCQ